MFIILFAVKIKKFNFLVLCFFKKRFFFLRISLEKT